MVVDLGAVSLRNQDSLAVSGISRLARDLVRRFDEALTGVLTHGDRQECLSYSSRVTRVDGLDLRQKVATVHDVIHLCISAATGKFFD